MAISVDWATQVISVPRADMPLIHPFPEVRQLDVNDFRLALKDLEDGQEGMCFPDTHRHNTEVILGGVTYARFVEIINGYTITFEDGQYGVQLTGANNNVADVMNLNQVSIRSANSAGLIVTGGGGGGGAPTADEVANAVWAKLLPGAFGAGQAGKVVGDNLNATVGSRAVPGASMSLTMGERAALDGYLSGRHGAGSWEGGGGGGSTPEEIAQAVWDKWFSEYTAEGTLEAVLTEIRRIAVRITAPRITST